MCSFRAYCSRLENSGHVALVFGKGEDKEAADFGKKTFHFHVPCSMHVPARVLLPGNKWPLSADKWACAHFSAQYVIEDSHSPPLWTAFYARGSVLSCKYKKLDRLATSVVISRSSWRTNFWDVPILSSVRTLSSLFDSSSWNVFTPSLKAYSDCDVWYTNNKLLSMRAI